MILALAVLFTIGAVIEAIEGHWTLSGMGTAAAVALWVSLLAA